MQTRDGRMLATKGDRARVAAILHDGDGRIQVTDPATMNYGIIELPNYVFEIESYNHDVHV